MQEKALSFAFPVPFFRLWSFLTKETTSSRKNCSIFLLQKSYMMMYIYKLKAGGVTSLLIKYQFGGFHMKEKVILAYSGGLDTTAIIPWLKEQFERIVNA